MKFITSQSDSLRDIYFNYLRAICSLSKLFSDSEIPYLYYRVSENIFCKSFNAENLSRDDLAYDAKKDNMGIGLKTFTEKGKYASEKIAEFNAFSKELRNLNSEELVLRLTELRNERIKFANRTYGIEKAIYHCIARKERILKIFETNYELIDKNTIKNIKSSNAGIQFKDGKNEYAFNFSKSTLFKKFEIPITSINLPIEILEDPYELILTLFEKGAIKQPALEIPGKDFIVLPLYSLRESKKSNKIVSEKSGLNQWNAGGRKRDVGEVYIPIPVQIHKNFSDFLPSRDKSFNLHLPTGKILSAKVCQENSKALMTNPNNALSDWLLRKVLELKEGQLLTYKRLKLLGIDSIRLVKMDNNNFKIDFAKIDSYDNFQKYFIAE